MTLEEARQIGLELIALMLDSLGHGPADFIPDTENHGMPDGISPVERNRQRQRIHDHADARVFGQDATMHGPSTGRARAPTATPTTTAMASITTTSISTTATPTTLCIRSAIRTLA